MSENTVAAALAGRVIAISGVGPGLGQAMARQAARRGASVVCVARTGRFVEQVAAEIVDTGGAAMAVAADITAIEDCRRVAALIEDRFGCLNGLVNSAYTAGVIAPFHDADLGDWRNTFEINVFGTLRLIQSTLPLLRRGGGVVININTMSATRPMKNQGAYGASKAAMEFLTRQLAVEFGHAGVRFNTVYCGPMRGPNLDAAIHSWASRRGTPVSEIEHAVASVMALDRVPSDAEASEAIVMLLSDKASMITGATAFANNGAWVEQHL